MKKITLIACAAVLAGLLLSCNNGAKDYNDVTKTDTKYSYLVKGTITTVTETASEDYDEDDKLDYIDSLKKTETYTIVSTPAFVTFTESEQYDRNYDFYDIRFDSSTGYFERVTESKTTWDFVEDKKKEWTSTELGVTPYKVEKEATPGTNISGEWVTVYDIDGTLYYKSNDKYVEATVDAAKLAAGEDFTYSVTVVTDDSSNENTSYDKDGKKDGSSKSSTKITKTYSLTFTAQ